MAWIAWGLAAALFAGWTVRGGKLTAGGAAAAVVLAGVVGGFAGVAWWVPLFIFFLSSVAIGRWLPAEKDAGDEKDARPRDAIQVLCNGGVYGLMTLTGAAPTLLLVAMAVATADTWASEVGKFFRQPTYDILRWRRVPPGLSGGVSGAGTLAGAAGAVLLAASGWLVTDPYPWSDAVTVAGWGFAGMLIDSVLGAAVQARYRGADGTLTDRGGGDKVRVRGYPWMSNDGVNLASIAITVALAWLSGR